MSLLPRVNNTNTALSLIQNNKSYYDIASDVNTILFASYDSTISHLILPNSSFPYLKVIVFGSQSYHHVREFVIDGLESLKSVKIGVRCFRAGNGVCRVTNCPNLRQLEIGMYSFCNFKSFELFNLNSLQSIEFGDLCFSYADFSLKGE